MRRTKILINCLHQQKSKAKVRLVTECKFKIMERNDKIAGANILIESDIQERWISNELISEFKQQYQTTEYDANGCDVTLIADNGKQFHALVIYPLVFRS